MASNPPAPSAPPARAKRLLSGIQPSGQLHLGNYFGAMIQHLGGQDGARSIYFIADFHALTTVTDGAVLRDYTLEVAATYLALGLDPERCVFFRQSDVPEVCELTWLLLTATPFGELERAHSYKDKTARGLAASGALFTYPALMAADILAYDADLVPVGKDQVQHIEIAREIARGFHARYGREVFVLPEAMLNTAPTVPGLDGQKMSKSYDNHIPIFLTGKALKKRLAQIVTDSRTLEEPKDPSTCNVFALYSLFASEDERAVMADAYRRGGYGYGHAKDALREKIETRFADARDRFAKLRGDEDAIERVLALGAAKARPLARATLDRARAACGLAAGARTP
jgi:tryptophanyl-tRNA synthetase